MAKIEIKDLKNKLTETSYPRDILSQEVLLIKGGRWVPSGTGCGQIWVY
jgi:hypothetical protein